MSSCAHIPGLCCPLWPPLYYCFSVSCRVMMLGSHWWEVATSAIRSHAAFPSKVISYPCLWGFCIMNHIRLLTGILWDAYKLLMLFCIVDCPLICTNYRELGCTYMGITTWDKGLARHLQLFFSTARLNMQWESSTHSSTGHMMGLGIGHAKCNLHSW